MPMSNLMWLVLVCYGAIGPIIGGRGTRWRLHTRNTQVKIEEKYFQQFTRNLKYF